MSRRPLLALIAAAVAAGALVGCGDSSEPPQPTGDAGPPPGTVTMGEFYYRPTPTTVRVGEPVTFVNEGAIEHTVADTTPGGEIRSRLIKPRPLKTGERQRVVFRNPGVVHYICTFHPTEMSGSLTVEP